MNRNGAAGLLDGRHALVTGAGRGIGAAIAAALASQGARLTLLGRNRDSLEAVARSLPGKALVAIADVSDRAAVRSAFAMARSHHGEVGILVNNAGQAATASLPKTDEQLFQSMLAVNLAGTYHCIHEALPAMLAARSGRIINIASTAGLIGYAYCAAYCAAKHGVIGLTRSIALEVAERNVTVNAVCPGFTDTDIVKAAVANISAKTGRTEQEAIASLVAHNPQRRLITPAEVANAVMWLCLPGSESVTGQSLPVAGGEVM